MLLRLERIYDKLTINNLNVLSQSYREDNKEIGWVNMESVLVWLFLLVVGAISGVVTCSAFGGNEINNGYAAMLGMIVSLLSGVFFQLNHMQQSKK